MSNQIIQRKAEVNKILAGDYGERIKSVLGNEKKFARFKSAIVSICLNEQLSECSLTSILQSAKDLAEIDLDINPLLGQAYIVRYKHSAQAIISYKGYISLAERFGKQVKAFSVFKCDDFEIDLSDFDEKIVFKPNFAERKESDDVWFKENLIGVLVKVREENGSVKNQFVSKDKLFKIAGVSPSRNSKYSPYEKWGEEMFLAKALKYVLSKMPMNEKISRAIEIDNVVDKQQVESMQKESDTNDVVASLIDDVAPQETLEYDTETGEIIEETTDEK